MGRFAVVDRKSLPVFEGVPEDYPDGFVIVLDKPYEWTSADAVRKIKFGLQRRFGLKKIKVGHAGTLDPLATGLLLVCVGKATKISESLQAEKKEYLADLRFGATTPSFDLEHEIDAEYPYEHITRESLQKVLDGMSGEQDQLPPIYSAKYIDGMRAYEKARMGEVVELKTARIQIYGTQILDFSLPQVRLSIQCSKGTYIRAFARDLGMALDSGAHLTGLRRISSGGFHVDDALSLEEAGKLFGF